MQLQDAKGAFRQPRYKTASRPRGYYFVVIYPKGTPHNFKTPKGTFRQPHERNRTRTRSSRKQQLTQPTQPTQPAQPILPQDRPKTASRPPKTALRPPKTAPRPPKSAPRSAKTAQKSPQERPKIAPRAPKTSPRPPWGHMSIFGRFFVRFWRQLGSQKQHQNRSKKRQKIDAKNEAIKTRNKTVLGPSWGDLKPILASSWGRFW